VSPNFAIDPQFGMAVFAPEGGSTTVGVLVGSRFLFSAVNAASLRFNLGGELLATFGTTGTTFAGLTFGLVAGIEYFFTELRNLSFEVYFGLPFGLLLTPATNFGMVIGGNVIAGFHYYF
jgi:hypothetical protein